MINAIALLSIFKKLTNKIDTVYNKLKTLIENFSFENAKKNKYSHYIKENLINLFSLGETDENSFIAINEPRRHSTMITTNRVHKNKKLVLMDELKAFDLNKSRQENKPFTVKDSDDKLSDIKPPLKTQNSKLF